MTIARAVQFIHKWTSSLWQRAVLFGVAYFLCAQMGSYLSGRGGAYVSFWMPAGFSIAVLLLNRTRDWPWFILAALFANFLFDSFHGTKVAMIFIFCFANLVEIFLGAWMVRTFVSETPRLKTLREFFGVMVFGAALNSMVSAVISAPALVHFGMSRSFTATWTVLWGSDFMAILVLAPFILTWFSRAGGAREIFGSRGRMIEAALLLAGLSCSIWYLFYGGKGVLSPNKSIAIPFLLWAGLRFGMHGATAACLCMSLELSFLSSQAFAHFRPGTISASDYFFVLQTVLATGVLVSLIPAIVLAERDHTMAKLRESEEYFRNLTQAAFEGIAISENGRFLDVNEQMLKMFGCTRDEMIGHEAVDFVAPGSRAAAAACIQAGRDATDERHLLRKDGSIFIAEVRAKMVHLGGRALRMTALRDVTAYKKVEQALRESEEKFSKAFRASPDVMSIADFQTGRYIEVNEAHQKIFGFTREEAIGRSPVELGLLENSEAREQMIRSLKEHGRITNCEVQARTRDGRTLTMVYSAEMIELGGRLCVLRVSHDITDRKRAEEALRESERRFRGYFELASVGFAITGRDMRLLSINDEYCRILGYPREELLQKTWAELTYPEDMKANQALFEETLAGKTEAFTLDKRMIRRDGGVINTTVSARCVRAADGTPDYFVSLLLDTTEREQAIEREQRARAEYTLQLIASQEADRARIAGDLHDSLGQTLSVIKNHAQLMLLQKRLSLNTRKQIETISEATATAIAEMRRISQDLHPYQLDHLGLTRSLESLIDGAAQASKIHFNRKLDPVDDAFSGDAAANLYRVVQECLNNILKHSGAHAASVTLARGIHDMQLVIEDDGAGFDPKKNGSGMGLKNIAERTRILHGTLKIEAAPEKGARIEIKIPISTVRV